MDRTPGLVIRGQIAQGIGFRISPVTGLPTRDRYIGGVFPASADSALKARGVRPCRMRPKISFHPNAKKAQTVISPSSSSIARAKKDYQMPGIPNPAMRRSSVTALHQMFRDPPVLLQRTDEGLKHGRRRLLDAQEFLEGFINRPSRSIEGQLYQAGTITDAALKAYLLYVGFPDTWCGRYIGPQVSKALAYANATGLSYGCRDMARLSEVLSPYWKWNKLALTEFDRQSDGGFERDRIAEILITLTAQVVRE